MSKPLQLEIKQPCHENWYNMTPMQQGRFCGSCQKTVVDFSDMSDKELLAYFKNYNGNTCGRFDDNQLLRPLVAVKPPKPGWVKWVIASLLSFLMLSTKAKAQGQLSTKGECSKEPVIQKESSFGSKRMLVGKVAAVEMKGRVVDEKGGAIPFASVQVKEEKWGVSADSLGNYTMRLPLGIDSVVLIYSAVGFESVEKSFIMADAANQRQEIVLALKSYMGDVIVTGYGISERLTGRVGGVSVVRSVKKIKKESPPIKTLQRTNNLYPNPAVAGSAVYLSFKSAGYFGWRLMDASGKIIESQTPTFIRANEVQRVALPADIASGIYFVQVLNADGKIITTSKLMVTH